MDIWRNNDVIIMSCVRLECLITTKHEKARTLQCILLTLCSNLVRGNRKLAWCRVCGGHCRHWGVSEMSPAAYSVPEWRQSWHSGNFGRACGTPMTYPFHQCLMIYVCCEIPASVIMIIHKSYDSVPRPSDTMFFTCCFAEYLRVQDCYCYCTNI